MEAEPASIALWASAHHHSHPPASPSDSARAQDEGTGTPRAGTAKLSHYPGILSDQDLGVLAGKQWVWILLKTFWTIIVHPLAPGPG